MKVPSYQTQISYKAAQARPVQLVSAPSAKPNKWEKVGIVNQLVQNGLEIYDGVKRILSPQVRSSTQKAPSSGQEIPGPISSPKLSADQKASWDFSDPVRNELMQAGGIHKFGEEKSVEDFSTAVEALDQYVNGQLTNKQIPQEKEPLWAQDYVILRHELQHLQQQHQRETERSSFRQATQHFVQTAGLIRSAGALEQYVQDNLTAAEQEAIENGISSTTWQKQKEQLYAQAITHNIHAALQAGEISQAQAVVQHFAGRLPSWQLQQLQTQIQTARAAEILDGYWSYWQADGRDEQGQLNKARMQEMIHQAYAETALEAPLTQAFEQRWQQYQQECWTKQAQYYASCLQGKEIPPAAWLEGQTPKQQALSRQLVAQCRLNPHASSQPAVFNAFYEQILSGTIQESALDRAFEEKQLSAPDTLRLKKYFCEKQAGSADMRQKILSSSLEHFCRQYELTDQEMQAAKYWVYTAGVTVKEQLHAAQELKQLFTLQEKNK